MIIKTRSIHSHEWLAWDDDNAEGPLGLGHSEESAIEDLQQQVEARTQERSNA